MYRLIDMKTVAMKITFFWKILSKRHALPIMIYYIIISVFLLQT